MSENESLFSKSELIALGMCLGFVLVFYGLMKYERTEAVDCEAPVSEGLKER